MRHLSTAVLLCASVVFKFTAVAQEGFVSASPPKDINVEYPKGLLPPLPTGTVSLATHINEQGKVDSVVIVHPQTWELNDAATQAVSKWQFLPATQEGRPISSQLNIDVVFEDPHPYAVFNGVYRVFEGSVTPPIAAYAPDPKYTKAARKAKIAGTVVLRLVVNKQGLPEQIRIQKALDPGLDQAAIDAVKQWKFEPSRKDDQPVAVMINVEINFKLN